MLFTAALTAVFASLAASPARAESVVKVDVTPPVLTCSWIADHPAAAAAQLRVTCDEATFLAATVLPFAPLTTLTVTPLLTNTDVPVGHHVGKGVFAWSDYGYTDYYTYSAYESPAYYTAYVQQTNGVNIRAIDHWDTQINRVYVPGNWYRWGAQNHLDVPQQWNIYWG